MRKNAKNDFDGAARVRTSPNDLSEERHDRPDFVRKPEGRVHHEKPGSGKGLSAALGNR